MTQLVTGATGLIGGHIVRRLAAEGERVRALVRPNSRVDELEQLGVELVVGDLRDADSVVRAVQDVSIVFHCGGLVSDWGRKSDFFNINVEGTRHVIDAAASAKIERLVHLSSASVYGYRGTSTIKEAGAVGESEPLDSRGIPYIESKIAAERILYQAIDQGKLDAVVLRPVMVFGPHCQNYVGEVVRHLRTGTMLLLDGGRHVAGLAYVENVVDACLLAGRVGGAKGAFNICDDLPITWNQYIGALADGIGVQRPSRSLPTWLALRLATCMELAGRMMKLRRRPLLTRLAVLELGQPQSYDISRARRVLGYSPRIDFDSAMQKTLEWVKTSL